MPATGPREHVFINCPFDAEYLNLLFRPVVFTVVACGFIPRCALETPFSVDDRLGRLIAVIRDSRYSVSDISRVELSGGLPRLNMPFELGIFIGAMQLGRADQPHSTVSSWIRNPNRYRQTISDLSGADIGIHHNEPHEIVGLISDWLASGDTTHLLPGTEAVWRLFGEFHAALPALCLEVMLIPETLRFSEYVLIADVWLKAEPPRA